MKLPLFILRRLVRRNPWLLSNAGMVSREHVLRIGPLEIVVHSRITLTDAQREALAAEK